MAGVQVLLVMFFFIKKMVKFFDDTINIGM